MGERIIEVKIPSDRRYENGSTGSCKKRQTVSDRKIILLGPKTIPKYLILRAAMALSSRKPSAQ
jgi:hypothetical protein